MGRGEGYGGGGVRRGEGGWRWVRRDYRCVSLIRSSASLFRPDTFLNFDRVNCPSLFSVPLLSVAQHRWGGGGLCSCLQRLLMSSRRCCHRTNSDSALHTSTMTPNAATMQPHATMLNNRSECEVTDHYKYNNMYGWHDSSMHRYIAILFSRY